MSFKKEGQERDTCVRYAASDLHEVDVAFTATIKR
jgi:hypothetical protein